MIIDPLIKRSELEMKLARLNNRIDTIVAEGGEPNVINVVQKNGVALQVNNKTVNVTVPTKTSDLTNDSGYTPNAVTSVNGQTGAVTISVPTKTSDLVNDSGFITSYNGVEDVMIDNASIVTSKIAIIPKASSSNFGVVKVSSASNYVEITNDVGAKKVPLLDSNNKIPSSVLPSTTGANVYYGTTDSTTQTKTVTLNPSTTETIKQGDLLVLSPTVDSGSYVSITLSISPWGNISTGQGNSWKAYDYLLFYYNGSQFVLINRREAGLEPYTKTEVDNLIDGVEAQIPTVPTNVSAFTNDSGYITSSALNGYATENYVNTAISGITPSGEANVIETVKVNGDALTVTNKAVDVQVPVTTAHSTNAYVVGEDAYYANMVYLGLKYLQAPQNVSYTTESVYVPKITVTNGKIGIDSRLLSDYYTKTEIDSMIGDIESLLGAI